MNRRSFLGGFIAGVASLYLPNAAYSILHDVDYFKKIAVVNSFPVIPVNTPGSQYIMFLCNNGEHPLGLTIKTQGVDSEENFQLDKIFSEDLTTLEYADTRPMLNAVISGANKVAMQTKRGRGNHYTVFSDHILVWYQAKNYVDGAAQLVGSNIAYNPNYKDYFVRVKCDNSLSDKDYRILEELGYTKI